MCIAVRTVPVTSPPTTITIIATSIRFAMSLSFVRTAFEAIHPVGVVVPIALAAPPVTWPSGNSTGLHNPTLEAF